MKRKTAYGLIAVLLAVLIGAALIGLIRLAATPEGTRWLLSAVSRYTVLTISAQKVEGELLGHLRLEEVRLTLAPFEVEIGRIDWHCQPLPLLSGTVFFRELTLTNVRIQDNTPANVIPDLTWPRINGIAALFDARIERLQVQGLTWQMRDEPPFSLNEISAAVLWRHTVLSFSALDATTPDGRLKGSITAGFALPSLGCELAWTPAKAVGGLDDFSLTGLFHPGTGTEQLAGGVTLLGSSAKAKRLELTGEIGMTRKALRLRKFRLTQPGRRGFATGAGTLTPTAAAPLLALQLTAVGIDLTPELKIPTDLSGTLTLTGTTDSYEGELKWSNRGKGWQRAQLSGSFRGNTKGVKLSPATLSALSGFVRGNLILNWENEFRLQGELRGGGLNPAEIASDWAGVVNFALTGNVVWPHGASPRGDLNGRLLESRLHGQALTGDFRATFSGDDLQVDTLALRGKGFALQCAGNLRERLAFSAEISALERLIPRTTGELHGSGWVRLRAGQMEGSVSGRGAHLAGGQWKAETAALNARFGNGREAPLNIVATLRKSAYGKILVDSATLSADGTVAGHTINLAIKAREAEAHLSFSGAYDKGSWRGKVVRLSGRDATGPWRLTAPAALAVAPGRIELAPIVLIGGPQERLELSGALTTNPLDGSFQATGNGLNPARAKPWLPGELQLDGAFSGRAAGKVFSGERLSIEGQLALARGRVRWHQAGEAIDANLSTAEFSWNWQGNLRVPAASSAVPGATPLPTEKLTASGRAEATGEVTVDGRRIAIEEGSLHIAGNERGLTAGIGLALAGGGTLRGDFTSPLAATLALPAEGTIGLNWTGIDLALLRPWLPPTLAVEGALSGRATGNFLTDNRLSLQGEASLAGGKIRRLAPEGEINANLRSASLTWNWQGEALRGTFALALAERGEARGSFQLPLPARLPAVLDRRGTLRTSLTGQLHEKGLLSSLFPGFIRESRGELDVELRIGGTWEEPTFDGTAKLGQAGAYLPTAGIQLRDVQLSLRLGKDLLTIDSFRALSGPGHLEGSGQIRLKGWQVTDYRGNIGGERFQSVYLPELQILMTPSLTFEGTPGKLSVRGEVQLPELLIFGPPTRTVIQPSSDVILTGAPKSAEKVLPLALDVQVRLSLGERVLAKVAGIDAQLGGTIDLQFQNLDKIASRGEIKVVKGRYRAYGVDLEIVRGRLFYTGGPLNQPTLDILALRTVGDVKAGITAAGTLRAPLIKLYSEPAMPDADILAYIVFGQPLSNRSTLEQVGMMAQAAGALLSKGKSASLLEQIKNRLGISTLEIQSESPDSAGRMGYKEIKTTPTGAASQTQSVSESMLTVGKYLTPQLYFSYGRSLFTGGYLFRLRYDLFKQWQIETQTGTESGVDLYYRIDFN